MTRLADPPCGPCTGATPRLSADEARELVSALSPGWTVDGDRLVKSWKFPDFAEALAWVNRVAEVAEAAGHHPDVELGWGRVRLSVYTHAIGGLSRADFVLAARVDVLETAA